jgi:uncharacterized SAM-binding protein YcdF (DUF218 family)
MDMLLDAIAELVKAYLLPGSMSLFLLATTVLVAWWFINPERRGGLRLAMFVVVSSYWLMSLPWFANLLERAVTEDNPADPSAESVAGMVVLGGGEQVYRLDDDYLAELSQASAVRALEAARLYGELQPEWVFVSGGPGRDPQVPESWPLRDALIHLKVPEERIILESASSDTRQQALLLAPTLEEMGISEFYLVTSATHMLRARLAFTAVGLDPIPAPAAPRNAGNSGGGDPQWLPSVQALGRSTDVSREILALAYYWARGWL